MDLAYGVGVADANANTRARAVSANRCIDFNPCIEPAMLRTRGSPIFARSRIMEVGSREPALLVVETCLGQLRSAPQIFRMIQRHSSAELLLRRYNMKALALTG